MMSQTGAKCSINHINSAFLWCLCMGSTARNDRLYKTLPISMAIWIPTIWFDIDVCVCVCVCECVCVCVCVCVCKTFEHDINFIFLYHFTHGMLCFYISAFFKCYFLNMIQDIKYSSALNCSLTCQ